jgi:hypothetical protein
MAASSNRLISCDDGEYDRVDRQYALAINGQNDTKEKGEK